MPTEESARSVPAGQVWDASELAAQIAAAEERLTALRATRDARVREEHQSGVSKYALAKRWGVTENTVTRILVR